MNLLLAYLFFVVAWGLRAGRKERPIRSWVLLAVTSTFALGYLSLRFV